MSKTLLAVGDSWTDPNYPSYYDNQVETWDSKLGKKLGYNVVNRGQSAASNEKIVKMAIDYLSQNKAPDLICVVWSEQHRVNLLYQKNLIPMNMILQKYHGDECAITNEDTTVLLNPEVMYDRLYRKGYDRHVPDEFFRNIWTLQYIADTKGIPIYHACGVNPWSDGLYMDYNLGGSVQRYEYSKRYERFLKYWTRSKYFKQFDDDSSNFIGWPFLRQLGGTSFSESMGKGRRISDTDGHPNNQGMEFVANAFFEKIKV